MRTSPLESLEPPDRPVPFRTVSTVDLTDRITEQLGQTIERLQDRVTAPLSDRDKAAIALALVEAATTGARVAYGAVLANAAAAGLAFPPGRDLSGLRDQELWPFDD